MKRSELYQQVLDEQNALVSELKKVSADYRKLLEYADANPDVTENNTGETVSEILINYIESLKNTNYVLKCDYCDVVVTDPWHGSGTLKGKECKHIHACDNCRSQLPPTVGTKQVWLDISGDGFSNSWVPEEVEKYNLMSLDEMKAFIESHKNANGYKLIEYRCLTDAEFEFSQMMKLR